METNRLILIWEGQDEISARNQFDQQAINIKNWTLEKIKNEALEMLMKDEGGLNGDISVYVGNCSKRVIDYHRNGVFIYNSRPQNLIDFLTPFYSALFLLPSISDKIAFMLHSCKALWLLDHSLAKDFAKIFGFKSKFENLNC